MVQFFLLKSHEEQFVLKVFKQFIYIYFLHKRGLLFFMHVPKNLLAPPSLTGLTRSLASIFCPPRNHSTEMPSYDSSHSKVAVSPAVTVTSVRGRISPMDRAEEEEDEDMVNRGTSMHLWDCWRSCSLSDFRRWRMWLRWRSSVVLPLPL